jgi:hypothetical protein
MTPVTMQRTRIVEGWLWWASFHVGIARGFGVINSWSIANAACRDLWTGQPTQLTHAS